MKAGATLTERTSVSVPAGEVVLNGDLSIPQNPKGMILFAHGSGSSRLSPRNRYVAEVLNEHSLATLLVDLRRPAGFGRRGTSPGAGADAAHRGGQGHGGSGTESRGDVPDEMPRRDQDRSGRDAPV